MINLEKYYNEIKELGNDFGVIRSSNKPTECSTMPCENCKFYDAVMMNNEKSCKEVRFDWLFSEEQILTNLKITQLMCDRALSFDGEVCDCKDINCNRCVFHSDSSICSNKKLELLKKTLKETY